jgi:hypothetical protein
MHARATSRMLGCNVWRRMRGCNLSFACRNVVLIVVLMCMYVRIYMFVCIYENRMCTEHTFANTYGQTCANHARAQVREAVLHVVAGWLQEMPAQCTPRLLPILLHGIGDEQEAVRDTCVALVDKVRGLWCMRHAPCMMRDA